MCRHGEGLRSGGTQAGGFMGLGFQATFSWVNYPLLKLDGIGWAHWPLLRLKT